MNKYLKIIGFGILLWIIPFFAGFPFFDPETGLLISETFFKTIMIITGSLVSVFLAAKYFQGIKKNYVHEGIVLGFSWLAINWAFDLVMVQIGFFPMTITAYFTDIGLRYLAMPIYTIGIGYILEKK